jgi:hypothetical protein
MSQSAMHQSAIHQPGEFCFCTLAIGDRYRIHAQILAQDIQDQMPNSPLLILTDRPEAFKQFPNVLAFKHQIQSIKGYHDKRFVLEKALSQFERCLFLDSDVRVLGPMLDVSATWNPGITARAGTDLANHMKNMTDRKMLDVIHQAAQTMGIDLQTVQWLHEFMFVMTREDGLEQEFFKQWQTLSYFFESQGIYGGESFSIGLAAAKVGMNFEFMREDIFPFFKDNIERVRVKNGQSNLQDKQPYFDHHASIEHPRRSVVQKIMTKLTQRVVFYFRLLRLRLWMRQDPHFLRTFKAR